MFKSCLCIEDGPFGSLHMTENNIAANIPRAILPILQKIKAAWISIAMQNIIQPIFPVYAGDNAPNDSIASIDIFLQPSHEVTCQRLNQFLSFFIAIINYRFLSLCDTFKNSDAPSFFGLAAEFCST